MERDYAEWRERMRRRLREPQARVTPPQEGDPDPAALIAAAAERKRNKPKSKSYDNTRTWGVVGTRAYQQLRDRQAARRQAIRERGAQVCTHCKRDLPLDKFPTHKVEVGAYPGERRYDSQCRECRQAKKVANREASRLPRMSQGR